MRRIAIALTVVGAMLLGATSAQAATLNEVGGIVYYVAGQGERNDIQVGVDSILGGTVNVYTFKDADANPIAIGGGRCELINGVGMCRQSGLSSFVIDARDRDDTITVSTAGSGLVPPLRLGALMIGGRGVDVLMGGLGNDILKGNDGRDSLRGREGADAYKGGRGRDTLQTLDGIRDTLISCGDGSDDVLRKDKLDPRGRHCEHSNHKNMSKAH
ncbi:MAG TPA: calcium-binding protein [Solirubrobacterales bacterium]|nr:calcium-binding protein [Solirubrobacterales bacterium]